MIRTKFNTERYISSKSTVGRKKKYKETLACDDSALADICLNCPYSDCVKTINCDRYNKEKEKLKCLRGNSRR